MTTATTTENQAVEIVAVVSAEKAVALRPFEGKVVKLPLTEEQQHIAAEINDRVKREDGSTKLARKDFYAVAESTGLSKAALQASEKFLENAAIAFHAVVADDAISTMKEDANVSEYTARMEMGKNTTYKDTVSRFDTRTVSQGAGAERRLQETFGYHNPSIKTKYKSFEDNRQAVHALAKDLLG